MNKYHVPVLLSQCIEGLNINPNGIYVDVTFGGGGHSKAILDKLDGGRLIAFDRDQDAHNNAWQDERLTLVHQNYRYIKNALRMLGIRKVDGILADLGVSSYQFDQVSRGFTIQDGAPLDMRMNTAEGVTAADVLHTYEEEDLANVFYNYGEIKRSRRLAGAIVEYRANARFVTSEDLKRVSLSVGFEKKEHQYLARIFQALRIEVNQELDSLKQFLGDSAELLSAGGRLVVMSYHSLEDRLVKNFVRSGIFEGEPERDIFGRFETPLNAVTRKAVLADAKEIKVNSRASSVRLRIAEKV